MAAAAIEIIGVVSGLLGLVQFGIDNFAAPETAASKLKIGVGLDIAGGLNNAGGDLPDVRLWNEGGEFLGISADPGKIDDGSTKEITVSHKGDNGQQATYALFSANTDAICVAYVSITWPDGNEYGWIGDWGRQCGATWYFSSLYIKGTEHQPDCMWIDSNGDQPQTGFQVHFPEFVTQSAGELPEGKDENYFCNAGPPFAIRTDRDPNGVRYWTSKKRDGIAEAFAPPTKSKLPRRQAPEDTTNNGTVSALGQDQLVVDNNPSHPTASLCESQSSVGPDFANIADGQFCRMSDKTLWPICDEQITDSCFNLDIQELVINGIAARTQKYDKVLTWGR